MFFFITQKQYFARVTKLEEDLAKVRGQLERALQRAIEERKALTLSLRTLATQLQAAEYGRDLIQKWGNDNLDELRALRRLEALVATYVKEVSGDTRLVSARTVFVPKLAASLRELADLRKKRGT